MVASFFTIHPEETQQIQQLFCLILPFFISHPFFFLLKPQNLPPATQTPNQQPHPATATADTFQSVSSGAGRLLGRVIGRTPPETAAGGLVCHRVVDGRSGMSGSPRTSLMHDCRLKTTSYLTQLMQGHLPHRHNHMTSVIYCTHTV